jgi:hypothetical protein
MEHHRCVDRGGNRFAVVAAQEPQVMRPATSREPTPALRKAHQLRSLPTTEVLRPLPPLLQKTVRLSVTPLLRTRWNQPPFSASRKAPRFRTNQAVTTTQCGFKRG